MCKKKKRILYWRARTWFMIAFKWSHNEWMYTTCTRECIIICTHLSERILIFSYTNRLHFTPARIFIFNRFAISRRRRSLNYCITIVYVLHCAVCVIGIPWTLGVSDSLTSLPQKKLNDVHRYVRTLYASRVFVIKQ